jgi:hypothetical protein
MYRYRSYCDVENIDARIKYSPWRLFESQTLELHGVSSKSGTTFGHANVCRHCAEGEWSSTICRHDTLIGEELNHHTTFACMQGEAYMRPDTV